MAALAVLTGTIAAPASSQRLSGGCEAVATRPWRVAGKVYAIKAIAAGRSCPGANVALTVRAPAGALLLTFTSAAADVPSVFGRAGTLPAMRMALDAWIAQAPALHSTRDLPSWKAGEEQARANGQVLQAEPGIDRVNYADLRKWGQPLFCFVQGRAGSACYALDTKNDRLKLIGITTPDR